MKVDEFIEMVSTTVETYAELFSDGDITTFGSNDEAHFILALSGVITSNLPALYSVTAFHVLS